MRLFVFVFVFTMMFSPSLIYSDSKKVSTIEELNDIDILVLVSDDCGWNLLDINETLEEMGVNIYTITNTDSHTITSCFRRTPIPMYAELLLSEFDLEAIDEYDGIVIPAGPQWRRLVNETDVNEFLWAGYDNGLVIGAICLGVITFAGSGIITNATKVAMPVGYSYEPMKNTGAEMVSRADVVSQERIVTAGPGGGPPTGYETAPNYEFCLEVIKEIIGQSYVESTSVIPNNETTALDYTIKVDIANLSLEFLGFDIAHVQQVIAEIYPEANSSDVTDVELTYVPGTTYYSGNFTVSNTGKYVIDLDIWNAEWSLEVVKNATTFLVESPETSTSDDDEPLPITFILGGGAIAVVVVTILVLWKRKS